MLGFMHDKNTTR